MTNGSMPEAPDGRHNSHAGTLLDAVPVALPDDPAELVEAGARDVLDETPAAPVADTDPVAAPPDADLAVVVPAAAGDADCAVVAGAAFAPLVAVDVVRLLPSVTTPPLSTLYGVVALVCANT